MLYLLPLQTNAVRQTFVDAGNRSPSHHERSNFLRIGGKSLEGVIASVGPTVVAEQLPDSVPQ